MKNFYQLSPRKKLFLGVKIPIMNSMNSLVSIYIKYMRNLKHFYLSGIRLKLFRLFRTCGNGVNSPSGYNVTLSQKRAPHALESFDIELFHIELLSLKSWLLSLQFLGQFWPWEGVKSGKNNGLWLRNGCHKNTYRNHRIKNVVSKAIRAIQGWFNYLKKGVDNMRFISKHNTKATFYHAKQCQNFYKLRSGSI